MTNQEMVDKIVNKSGITREQAEQALEMHDGDLLEAMIYVEKTYQQKSETSSSSFTTNPNAAFNSDADQQANNNAAQNFNVNEEKTSGYDREAIGGIVKKIIDFVVSNCITIMYNENEVATIPLIVWIVLFFSSISTLVVLMFIAMFFNVRFSFSGKDLGNDKANRVMSDIYTFVQNLKLRVMN